MVIKPDQKFRKRLNPQNTVYSAEQEANIKAIYVTQRTDERRVIITASLSTFMVVEGDINLKSPKTQSFIRLLSKERDKVTLLSVPGHMRLPVNEIADEQAKTALKYDLLATEKYPPQKAK
jgi:ribonuclease HI